MTPSDNKQIALTDQTTSLTSPKGMVDFARTLKQVIVEQELYTNIQGKNYVHVEAWQFCGAAMGVIAIVKNTERIITDNPAEYKYRAEVELKRIGTDEVVGSGVATCSNKERTKSRFDEYAVLSMAQTRAVGKAYRNSFGWLMKLSGFEATPHEEMDGVGEKEEKPAPKKQFPEIEADYYTNETTQIDPLTEAKMELNVLLEAKGTTTAPAKKAYLVAVLGKSTIETVEEAEQVIAKLREGK